MSRTRLSTLFSRRSIIMSPKESIQKLFQKFPRTEVNSDQIKRAEWFREGIKLCAQGSEFSKFFLQEYDKEYGKYLPAQKDAFDVLLHCKFIAVFMKDEKVDKISIDNKSLPSRCLETLPFNPFLVKTKEGAFTFVDRNVQNSFLQEVEQAHAQEAKPESQDLAQEIDNFFKRFTKSAEEKTPDAQRAHLAEVLVKGMDMLMEAGPQTTDALDLFFEKFEEKYGQLIPLKDREGDLNLLDLCMKVAYEMKEKKVKEIDRRDFPEHRLASSLLLTKTESGKYKFTHPFLLDYFASKRAQFIRQIASWRVELARDMQKRVEYLSKTTDSSQKIEEFTVKVQR